MNLEILLINNLKYSKLDNLQHDWIYAFIKDNPEMLCSMSNKIYDSLNDFEIYDIPKLIKIITEISFVYMREYNEHFITFVRFVLDTIIDFEDIQLESVINNSLDLLKFDLYEKKCCTFYPF